MRNTIVIIIVGLILIGLAASNAYTPTKFYNSTGQINHPMKVYVDTLTCTTGNGQAIDISAAGFTYVAAVNIMVERNTSTATSSPQVSIKSYSTTSITANITEGNGTLVTVLGLSVLSGASTQFVATPSTVKMHIFAMGY